MKSRLWITTLLFALFIVCGIDSAYALEFQPLTVKNSDGMDVSTGIVGEPIIFETTITNNEEEGVDFDVAFSTRTVKDKILDHQPQSISLKSGETKTLTYQFVPTVEGNYVSGIFFTNSFMADLITFPALDDSTDYQKKTARIYSDSADEDCNIACTDPSVVKIDVGTMVEWSNTTPDKRRISTGSYMEDKDGVGWSSDDRFHSTIIPERKSSFLFSQPGEYQLFLAEHRSSDVVGTILVLSDTFVESDGIQGILEAIMNDKNSKIPITSISVNPNNSIITVGIDDRKNPLFTLDVYKTMIYSQVGNVFLNIVADYTHTEEKICDVNDAAKVRKALDDDPVVRQFLEYYPSSTFEHFKTGDEPGNPRTYSEFRYELFLLRTLVLSHDEDGTCYPVYGYSISYDDPESEGKKDLFKNIYAKPDKAQETLKAVKDLSNPLKQHKFGISNSHITCKEGFVVLVKDHNQLPACVSEQTGSKLLDRGWMTPLSCDDNCDHAIGNDEKIKKIPIHDIRIDGLKSTYEVFEPINFTITMESYGIDHGGYEISIDGTDEKNDKERWYEAKDVPLSDADPDSFTNTYEFPIRESNPIVFSKHGWYEINFFVSESERAKWNFRVQYNDELDFTNNVQEFQEKLDPSMKYDDLAYVFGEPDNDIGSGIHIYVYDMDDGSKVLIGYGDYIWYAKHVDYNYNFMKDLLE